MFAYCITISSEIKHYTTKGNFVGIGSRNYKVVSFC